MILKFQIENKQRWVLLIFSSDLYFTGFTHNSNRYNDNNLIYSILVESWNDVFRTLYFSSSQQTRPIDSPANHIKAVRDCSIQPHTMMVRSIGHRLTLLRNLFNEKRFKLNHSVSFSRRQKKELAKLWGHTHTKLLHFLSSNIYLILKLREFNTSVLLRLKRVINVVPATDFQ